MVPLQDFRPRSQENPGPGPELRGINCPWRNVIGRVGIRQVRDAALVQGQVCLQKQGASIRVRRSRGPTAQNTGRRFEAPESKMVTGQQEKIDRLRCPLFGQPRQAPAAFTVPVQQILCRGMQ